MFYVLFNTTLEISVHNHRNKQCVTLILPDSTSFSISKNVSFLFKNEIIMCFYFIHFHLHHYRIITWMVFSPVSWLFQSLSYDKCFRNDITSFINTKCLNFWSLSFKINRLILFLLSTHCVDEDIYVQQSYFQGIPHQRN